ncbi:MAG: hypothetical protein ABSD46_03590 [Bacteroidota bacterium]
MKLPRLFLLFCTGTMLCLSSGCNDAPDSVGGPTQPKEDYGVIRDTTFYATGHSSLPNRLYTSTIDRFMLGKYQTYQAWACLKFGSWPDSMIGATITSATIRLKSVYHFGESMSVLHFDAYRARASWAGDSLTYDSLSLNTVGQSPYNYYYDVNTKHSSTIQAGDTDWVTIDIPDTSMLREWFSTNSDTMHLNDGIILSPNPSFSNVIRGFYSYYTSDTSYQPALYVNYDGAYGPNTYVHKVSSSKYVPTIDRASLITDNNLIYVQNGISYRGLISFDNFLTTPVSIHRAVLQVTLNVSKSSPQFNFFPTPFLHDSLFALSVGTDSISDGAFSALTPSSIDSGRVIYSFESVGLAKRWLNNSSARKIALCGYFESGSFDLFTFFSESAFDIKLRPRIIITYSIKR